MLYQLWPHLYNASDVTAEHKLLNKLLTDDFDLGWAKQGIF